jgi:serine protease Do
MRTNDDLAAPLDGPATPPVWSAATMASPVGSWATTGANPSVQQPDVRAAAPAWHGQQPEARQAPPQGTLYAAPVWYAPNPPAAGAGRPPVVPAPGVPAAQPAPAIPAAGGTAVGVVRVTTAPLRPSGRRVGFARGASVAVLVVIAAGAGAIGATTVSQAQAGTDAGAAKAALVPAARPVSQTSPGGTSSGGLAAAGDSPVIIAVAASAGPSVVTIDVTGVANANSAGGGQQFSGTGSGVIIEPDGLILTNHHVVQNAKQVTVTLTDGRHFPGTVKGIDTYTDLAFVKIDATDLPALALGDSSALQVGQLAVAIGDPLGQFPGSVTAGIVSGLDRTIDVASETGGAGSTLRHLIQTDASINPGNSGGPLLDGDGKVIGIDTAEAGSSQGIGFAIPIDEAKPIIEQVKAGKDIARPWLGIQYQELDAQIAKDQNLATNAGAWIHKPQQGSTSPAVVSGSPAEKAGLKADDIITELAGQAIDPTHPLDLVLLEHAHGDKVSLTVLRDGKTISVDVTLGTRPASLGQ